MADRFWVRNSGEGDGNWNDINNWSAASGGAVGASVPVTTDLAYFEGIGHDAGNGDANCTINAAVDVLGINIAAAYSGTISQGSYNIKTRASGVVQAGGTFTGGSGTFELSAGGGINLTGGIFTAPSSSFGVINASTSTYSLIINGATFNHNNGIFLYRGYNATFNFNSAQFYNVTINSGNDIDFTISSTMIVLNTLTLTSFGNILTNTIECRGDVLSACSSAQYHDSSTLLLINGTGAQALTGTSGTGDIPRVQINKASGTLTISGTLRIKNADGTNSVASVIYTTGTVVNTSTLVLTGNNYLAYAGGTGMEFQNVTVGTGNVMAGMTMTGTMVVNGTLLLSGTSGYGTGGTFKCRGDVEIAGEHQTTSAASCTFEFDGTGAQQVRTTTPGGTGNIGIIKINKASGTLTWRSGDSFRFAANSNTSWLWVQGTVVTTGSFFIQGGYTPTWNDSTTLIDNLTISVHDAHTMTITGTLKVNNFTVTVISSINGAVEIYGNLVRTDVTVGGTSTYTFKGSATQMVSGAGDIPNGTVTIDKTGGSVVLASDWNISAAGQDLVVTNGVLDLAGYNLTVADIFQVSGTLRLKGSETITAVTKTYNGTVEFYGAGTALLNTYATTYVNLIFGASKTHTITAATTINVTGSLSSNGTSITQSLLRSTVPGTKGNINLTGTSSLGANMDIQDNNAVVEIKVLGSKDSGNNTGWIFYGGDTGHIGLLELAIIQGVN